MLQCRWNDSRSGRRAGEPDALDVFAFPLDLPPNLARSAGEEIIVGAGDGFRLPGGLTLDGRPHLREPRIRRARGAR